MSIISEMQKEHHSLMREQILHVLRLDLEVQHRRRLWQNNVLYPLL
jgi:hypothetical protein